jgi:tetratricopeptide (TPR) repeat protein
MSDPLRTEPARALDGASAADRDAKIERLLLDGLDRYFSGAYDQAINVWTRVLFLDRAHPRARAYIERARAALAERQRESEELLQDGMAAFHRGESAEARRLLQDALGRGAPSDQALIALDRLNRVEQGAVAVPPTRVGDRGAAPMFAADAREPRVRVSATVCIALVASLVTAGLMVLSTRITWRRPFEGSPAGTGPQSQNEVRLLPIPRRGEQALMRGRMLADSGRLKDALAVLEQVRPTDAESDRAVELRSEIQKQLLGLDPRSGTVTTRRPGGQSPR